MGKIFQSKPSVFGANDGGGGGGLTPLYSLPGVFVETVGVRNFRNQNVVTVNTVVGAQVGMWFIYVLDNSPYTWGSHKITAIDADSNQLTLEGNLASTLPNGLHICLDWMGGAGLDKGLHLPKVGNRLHVYYQINSLFFNGSNYSLDDAQYGNGSWWNEGEIEAWRFAMNRGSVWGAGLNAQVTVDSVDYKAVGVYVNSQWPSNSYYLIWNPETKFLHVVANPGATLINRAALLDDILILG